MQSAKKSVNYLVLFKFKWGYVAKLVVSKKKHVYNICNRQIYYLTLTLFAEKSFPTPFTMTVTVDTTSVIRTTGHFAFGHWDVTFGSFPSVFTMANATSVMTVGWAEDWADTWKNKEYGLIFAISVIFWTFS